MPTITSNVSNGVYFGEHGNYSPLTIASGVTVSNTTTRSQGPNNFSYGVYDNPGYANPVLVNQGTIIDTIDAGFGVKFFDGGSVDNAAGALIQGSSNGVSIAGAAGTVTNSGTIRGGEAVEFSAGGSVVSNGRLEGDLGVYIRGATGTVTNTGTIAATNTGVYLSAGGNVDNSGTAAFIQGYFGVVVGSFISGVGGGTVTNGGTIIGTGGRGGTAVMFNGTDNNRLVLEHGYSLVGGVSVAGTANVLQLLGGAGAVTVDFDQSGAGFTSFGTVSFGAASGNDDILKITDTTSLPGTVSGFTSFHDIVDLTQLSDANNDATATLNPLTDVLTVTGDNGAVQLQLDTSEDYTGVLWLTSRDSGGGTNVQPACFLHGTLILTPDGEVAVEQLAIGDRLVTLSGEAKRLKWIGRRSYVGWLAAGNPQVLPVCFKPGSLADGVPRRELWVSPEHAMYLDGVLVPAELLVNGSSILKAVSVDEVEYFHLELDAHDVILAEGAWAESFVDDDSRGMFHNAAEYRVLYPEAPLHAPALYCAPRLEEGFELEALRRRLAGRARRLRSDGTAAAAAALEGNLDVVSHGRIAGWARDPASPETPVALAVLANGAEIGRIMADRYRRDLEAAGIGDGVHGFELAVPGGLAAAWPQTIEVCRADQWTILPGSPVVLQPATDEVLDCLTTISA